MAKVRNASAARAAKRLLATSARMPSAIPTVLSMISPPNRRPRRLLEQFPRQWNLQWLDASAHDERVGHGLVRRVDPHRLGARVVVDRIGAGFPPMTGHAVAAEGHDGRHGAIGVDPYD